MLNSIFRKRFVQTQVYAAIVLFAAGLILFPKETSSAAADGIGLCKDVLIPSLFPFFVISSMAVQTGLASYIGILFEKPMRFLFNVPGACAPAFVLGLVGGYPVGAKTALSLYEEKLCTKSEAERLLAFCNNSGPAFILGAVGGALFGGTMAGVLLYVAHILASVTVGVLFRGYKRREPSSRTSGRLAIRAVPLRLAFTSSTTSSFSSVLNICAFVIFFSVAIRLLYLLGILPAAASLLGWLLSPLGLDPAFAERILSGLFEVTTGIWGLLNLSGSLSRQLAAAAFMLGWAGLSVHCQVLNFIGDSGLSSLPYIGGKMLHGIISAVYTYIGAMLLPFSASASAGLASHISALSSMTAAQAFRISLVVSVCIWLIFCALVYFLTTKKHCKNRKKNL